MGVVVVVAPGVPEFPEFPVLPELPVLPVLPELPEFPDEGDPVDEFEVDCELFEFVVLFADESNKCFGVPGCNPTIVKKPTTAPVIDINIFFIVLL